MTLHTWLAFVAASTLLLIVPGPTILTVVGSTIAQGRSAIVPLVAGVALGDATALAVSLLGLGTLLATSAFWFGAVRLVGGVYLLYLGAKLLWAGAKASDAIAPPPPRSHARLFANTFLVTASNPKGIVFFVAFLPLFIDAHAPAAPQAWLLATTFVALASINTFLYARFAGAASATLASARARRGFHFVGGSLLSAAGVWALLARRPA